MTELGNRLKEARLAKGLSLDDVQAMTKIQKRYIAGIEEGNYSSMPGNFYVRAFVKQYAEALQLNPDEIFDTYKNDIPATHIENLPEQLSRVKSRKPVTEGSSKVFDLLPKILTYIFLIGAAVLLYWFFIKHVGNNSNESMNKKNDPVKIVTNASLKEADEKEKEKDKKKESEKEKKDNEQKKEAEAPPVEIPKQELTFTESSGSNSTYELRNADKFELKLVSKGQTWVNIKNDKGNSFFQGLLSVGGTESQTVDLSNESKAVIVVGRTIDTDIYINDQKLEYAVAPTEVVLQNITIQYVPKDK